MKMSLAALFFLSFTVFQAFAQPTPGDFRATDPILPSEEEYLWLYEELFSPQARQDYPDETFKSFRVHLKDSDEYFPAPKLIRKNQLKSVSTIRGTITYAIFFPKDYIYDVKKVNDVLVLNVRVHLKDATAWDINQFQNKLAEAHGIWNDSRPSFDFEYEFKFEIVAREQDAHFSVNVVDSTRGPYDSEWARNWTGRVLAHEVGHMMGLGDEYQTISGRMDCWLQSIMCNPWVAVPESHHYYFILRRLVR